MRFILLIIALVLAAPRVCAQNESVDTTAYETPEISDDGFVEYKAVDDTSTVSHRKFDSQKLTEMRKDSDLHYRQPPTVAESLWDRLLVWIAKFIARVLNAAMNTTWGNIIVYIIGIVLLIVIIMMLLKVNAFRVLYGNQGAAMKLNGIQDNIHEMNFEDLIQQAVAQNDHRRGIRLLFLYALRLLADRHLIRWEAGKTNHDYVNELQARELKSGLNDLSFYFDYAWYGNFSITADTYRKAEIIFNGWKEKLQP